MPAKSELCSFCWSSGCVMESTIQANLELTSPENVYNLVKENSGFERNCPQFRYLEILTGNTVPSSDPPREGKIIPSILLPKTEKPRSFTNFALWWSGIIEAGVNMDLKIKITRAGTLTLCPCIKFTDDDPLRRNLLLREFQSFNLLPSSGRWIMRGKVLEISGYAAAEFSQIAAPYARSRKDILRYYHQWSYESPDNWQKIAGSYQKHPNPNHLKITSQQYLQLLESPAFLAGIIDTKGNFSNQERSDMPGKVRRTLRVRSSNHSLLGALDIKFRGGLSSKTVTGSQEWRVSGPRCDEVLSQVKEHLRILPQTVNLG